MYLKQVSIENSGSIRSLNLKLPITDAGHPKPLVLVGGNGGGKTNFLATIADALFEAAAAHYDDALPLKGGNRSWFRVVGSRNLTLGTTGGFSLLRFDNDGTAYFFKEKAGTIDPSTILDRIPVEFRDQVNWPKDENFKNFSILDKDSHSIFSNGIYTYFPSSRSETPYWLNREAIPDIPFDTSPKFAKRLMKPIYVERSIEKFRQWLISLLSDARTGIHPIVEKGIVSWRFAGNPADAMSASSVLQSCNILLQNILSDNLVHFVWSGRKSPDKVAIARDGRVFLPNLDALSAGQSILLGMFGTIIQYGDLSQAGSHLDFSNIKGICLIDEVDAHIHIDLQYKIIPKLIKLFPAVQFIMSTHSPLFVLGMEREFGPDGILAIDMPNGTPVGAESYSEFGKALEAFAATNAFTKKVVEEARQVGKPIVYVEGETDAPYLKRAATLLGRETLLKRCDIEWIGAKDENGQGFNTGKDALKHTISVLRANPSIVNRKILLLYDNDSNAPPQDYDGFSVRIIPRNASNQKIEDGIENLLSPDCISDDFYQTKQNKKKNGEIIISKTIRKTDLCSTMCETGTAEQFQGFSSTLDIIEDYLDSIQS